MDATGTALTVTGTKEDTAEQPFALVTVTVKFPVEVTAILAVVSPLLHAYAAPAFAVKLIVAP